MKENQKLDYKMAIYVKALFFVVLIAAISAMPLDGQDEPQDSQVDLLSIENVPEQDVASSGSNDDLTRNKRNFGKFEKNQIYHNERSQESDNHHFSVFSQQRVQ